MHTPVLCAPDAHIEQVHIIMMDVRRSDVCVSARILGENNCAMRSTWDAGP